VLALAGAMLGNEVLTTFGFAAYFFACDRDWRLANVSVFRLVDERRFVVPWQPPS